MSTFIITVLKLLGSIVSGGLLFQAFVANNHAKPITKVIGVFVSLLTLLMFVIDVKSIFPSDAANTTEQLYWQSVENHPSAGAYQSYLTQYPEGKFAAIARTQLASYADTNPVANTQTPAVSTRPNTLSNTNLTESDSIDVSTQPETADLTALQTGSPPSNTVLEVEPQPIAAQKMTPTPSLSGNWQRIERYAVKDGLVRDTHTGLMWMRCSVGQHWQGSICQGQAIAYRWWDAMALAQYVVLSGYRNWRLPRHEELKTLVFCNNAEMEKLAVGRSMCTGDYVTPTLVNSVFPSTPPAWFWSSSSDDGYGRTAWGVNFNDGYDGWDFQYSKNYLRLVRWDK